jgi:hypothetical protein
MPQHSLGAFSLPLSLKFLWLVPVRAFALWADRGPLRFLAGQPLVPTAAAAAGQGNHAQRFFWLFHFTNSVLGIYQKYIPNSLDPSTNHW